MSGLDAETEALVCVPATLLARAAEILASTPVQLGGQDCHAKASGAHTGDISAEMLKDAGATHVIVGHSERRTDHGETDAIVHAKAEAAWRAGLVAIICIGETRAEREAGATLAVLSRQIAGSVPAVATAANTIVAYEPVWAIGTGLTPTVDDVAEAHAHIRDELAAQIGAEAAQHAHPLWRLGQAVQCRRIAAGRQCRRRAGRRRQPARPRISSASPRPTQAF